MKPSRPVTFESFQEETTRFLQKHNDDKELLHPRSLILKLGVLVGQLCASVLEHAPLDKSSDFIAHDDICCAMGRLFFGLCVSSRASNVDLRTAILSKMELNGRKYPVELCKGKSGKYTMYSGETGITKTRGQSTAESPASKSKQDEETLSVDGMVAVIRNFALEREWYKYHTPRSLVLALMGELGELAELFQWKGDGSSWDEAFSDKDRDHVGQEFADVTIYLLRLADVCSVDIGREALRYASEKHMA